MARTKVDDGQEDMFGGQQNFCYSEDDDMTTKMSKFIVERHKIYLKKTFLGKEKPWTEDPILRSGRFCNIYRELDTVSVWIIENIIKPYRDHPNLWFMLCIARIINLPESLQDLMDQGAWPEKVWNPEKVYKILDSRKSSGKKFITGAYLINSVFPSGDKNRSKGKAYYIPYYALDPMWKDREKIAPKFKTTLSEATETLQKYRGWAKFMSYQVVVDLSYSNRWLKNASDYNTFNAPGPGTERGLNRYFTGKRKPTVNKKDLLKKIVQQRDEVNKRLKELIPNEWWTGNMKTGFTEISLSNMSNANCEFDKHQRIVRGEGKMRSKYSGG